MKYYKGYLEKEWVRKKLKQQGKELWGDLLTEFCYELEREIEKETGCKPDQIISRITLKNLTLEEVSK